MSNLPPQRPQRTAKQLWQRGTTCTTDKVRGAANKIIKNIAEQTRVGTNGQQLSPTPAVVTPAAAHMEGPSHEILRAGSSKENVRRNVCIAVLIWNGPTAHLAVHAFGPLARLAVFEQDGHRLRPSLLPYEHRRAIAIRIPTTAGVPTSRIVILIEFKCLHVQLARDAGVPVLAESAPFRQRLSASRLPPNLLVHHRGLATVLCHCLEVRDVLR